MAPAAAAGARGGAHNLLRAERRRGAQPGDGAHDGREQQRERRLHGPHDEVWWAGFGPRALCLTPVF
ncbi:Hypothetical predicted protein [Podarcis lilfordi]|uniref:Uncharacterized protein n=1 Tax=Podarcis lilfordi TaxID=74358 RepID=A0AA35K0V2_9SAUR|nr:Hypothetical predicted protein [Podarcis lilfordi]